MEEENAVSTGTTQGDGVVPSTSMDTVNMEVQNSRGALMEDVPVGDERQGRDVPCGHTEDTAVPPLAPIGKVSFLISLLI